jgi:hypothetical protein
LVGENLGGGAHPFCFLVRVKAQPSWLAPGLSPAVSWNRSRGKKKRGSWLGCVQEKKGVGVRLSVAHGAQDSRFSDASSGGAGER